MHKWTGYHDDVIDYHLNSGDMPHVDTHTKAQAMGWARNMSRSFKVVDWSSLVGSFAAIAVHHKVPKEEAKKLALEISHLLGDISLFSNIIGGLWDEFKLHEKQEVDSALRMGRGLTNVTRRYAVKNYTLKLAEKMK